MLIFWGVHFKGSYRDKAYETMKLPEVLFKNPSKCKKYSTCTFKCDTFYTKIKSEANA